MTNTDTNNTEPSNPRRCPWYERDARPYGPDRYRPENEWLNVGIGGYGALHWMALGVFTPDLAREMTDAGIRLGPDWQILDLPSTGNRIGDRVEAGHITPEAAAEEIRNIRAMPVGEWLDGLNR